MVIRFFLTINIRRMNENLISRKDTFQKTSSIRLNLIGEGGVRFNLQNAPT